MPRTHIQSMYASISAALVLWTFTSAEIAYADHNPCPSGVFECGHGVKEFENDICPTATGITMLPIPGQLGYTPPWMQENPAGTYSNRIWYKAWNTMSNSGAEWDNHVVGTHSAVQFKNYRVTEFGIPSREKTNWANSGFEMYVMRQDLANGKQNVAGLFAEAPTVSGNWDTTRMGLFVYVHGAYTRRIFVGDTHIYAGPNAPSPSLRNAVNLFLRMTPPTACAYAYNGVPNSGGVTAPCVSNASYWEFYYLWGSEERYDPGGINGTSIRVSRELFYPVVRVFHGMESKGDATDSRSRIHLHTFNHKKYYFSICNCMDHCHKGELSNPETPCPYCEGAYWSESIDNIIDWNSLSESIENSGYDVFVPGSSGLPGHANDPESAVYDICKGPVLGTPCLSSCTPGTTAWGQDIGGESGKVYQCVVLMRANCPLVRTRIDPAVARFRHWNTKGRADVRAWRCGNCTCCNGGVSYCGDASLDNAAVASILKTNGLTQTPSVDWTDMQGRNLEIIAPGYGGTEARRQWGDNSEKPERFVVERYVHWFEEGGRAWLADSLVPEHPITYPGWNYGWVRAYGLKADECSVCDAFPISPTCPEQRICVDDLGP